jgi:putative YhdH/YhfP family quinone oxidoreductase
MFDNEGYSTFPIYKLNSVTSNTEVTKSPQWIIISWDDAAINGLPLAVHMHESIINNFNFDYVYSYFLVVASTGKPDAEAYLRALGAKEILDRTTLSEGTSKPLEATMWAAAVDCVGSTTLANVLPKIHYGGAVACSGVTGGGDLPTTMMPFVLRGVSLLGIDSVQTPIDRRRAVWERLGSDLKPIGLEEIGHDVGLDELDGVLDAILKGAATGRTVVDMRRS